MPKTFVLLAIASFYFLFAAPSAAEEFKLVGRTTGAISSADITDSVLRVTHSGGVNDYQRDSRINVAGFRVYSNNRLEPPFIGFPDSESGPMIAGTDSTGQLIWKDTDMEVQHVAGHTHNGNAGGNTGTGGHVHNGVTAGGASGGYEQFHLTGNNLSGTAARSTDELRISIGFSDLEIYDRDSFFDVPGAQAYSSGTLKQIIRWPTTGVGTMDVGTRFADGHVDWGTSPMQITPDTSSVSAIPVNPPHQHTVGHSGGGHSGGGHSGGGHSGGGHSGGSNPQPNSPRVVVSSEVVPRPPLQPAELVLRNTHQRELIVRIEDFRNPVDSREISIPSGTSTTVWLDRDSGSDLIQVFRDVNGVESVDRQLYPPSRIYDISVYEMKQQSISYNLDGQVDNATYVPQSVGKIEVPAGSATGSGTSDIYQDALRRQNPGAADRLRGMR